MTGLRKQMFKPRSKKKTNKKYSGLVHSFCSTCAREETGLLYKLVRFYTQLGLPEESRKTVEGIWTLEVNPNVVRKQASKSIAFYYYRRHTSYSKTRI